jgi:hypothetical protein
MVSLDTYADSVFEPDDSPEFRQYVLSNYDNICEMIEAGADYQRDTIAEMAAEGLGDAQSLWREWWVEQVRGVVEDMRRWWAGPDREELEAEVHSLREMLSELRAAVRKKDEEVREARQAADDMYYKLVNVQARAEAHQIPPMCKCGRITYKVVCDCGERLA